MKEEKVEHYMIRGLPCYNEGLSSSQLGACRLNPSLEQGKPRSI
jgi:hypothetical protein